MANNGQDRKLSTQLAEREITSAQWHTLAKSLYPGAQIESVLMVIDYCRSRGLDPLKKPCHIVPMEVKLPNGIYEWRDVVMPGIYELRTTAQKTGEYLGHSEPIYGELKDCRGLEAPESCSFTVYRWNPASGMRAEFPVTVWFSEVVGLKWDKDKGEHVPNARWTRAPRQMLTKCAEAAALREAFPDELGGQMSFEEMVEQRAADVDPVDPPFHMSKQAVTKIKNRMEAAIAEDDHGAIVEIWSELDDDQTAYVQSQLDRWRIKEWQAAITTAYATMGQEPDPNLRDPLPLDSEMPKASAQETGAASNTDPAQVPEAD